jgi:hypothetical protein
MRRDFRHAIRQLARHPRFAATIVIRLAVALGLSTAVATIADAFLIKTLPYPVRALLFGVELLDAQRTASSYC